MKKNVLQSIEQCRIDASIDVGTHDSKHTYVLEHSDSGKNNSIRFGSIHADKSIFWFDSIRFDIG